MCFPEIEIKSINRKESNYGINLNENGSWMTDGDWKQEMEASKYCCILAVSGCRCEGSPQSRREGIVKTPCMGRKDFKLRNQNKKSKYFLI